MLRCSFSTASERLTVHQLLLQRSFQYFFWSVWWMLWWCFHVSTFEMMVSFSLKNVNHIGTLKRRLNNSWSRLHRVKIETMTHLTTAAGTIDWWVVYFIRQKIRILIEFLFDSSRYEVLLWDFQPNFRNCPNPVIFKLFKKPI